MDNTDNDIEFSESTGKYLKDSQSAGLAWPSLHILAILKYYDTM